MKKIFRPGIIESTVFHTINTIFLILMIMITLYPFLNTIAVSLNDATDTIRGGIYLLPRVWTLYNYTAVFASGTVYNAFFISVARTVLAVILNLFLTTMLAYTLSRREFILRKFITTVYVLTMYFYAGLIPHYFLIKSLGLLNNFLVYVLPSMVSAFNLIVIRTYIRSLPESMIESARMDGAGDFRIFLRIIFPLCQPVLATIALFVAVGAWNSWFDSYIFCPKQFLSTLQFELMKLLATANTQSTNAAIASGGGIAKDMMRMQVTPISIRAAITIIAATPILVVYPFLQKHFVVGLNVGSVKE